VKISQKAKNIMSTVCGLDNYNAETEVGMVMVKLAFGCCTLENY
jgi:hypothetical protein